MTRRHRAFLLLGLALILGGLAASDVASREAALEQRLGPLTAVVFARAALPAGEPIDARRLAVRTVPARFAPRAAYADPAQVAGRRPATTIPAGADVTALADPAAAVGAPVRRGERVAEIVAVGPPDLVVAGARVDVVVTSERPARTTLALEDVEVLAARPAEDRVRASLRVTLRQAVYLAAAQSFAQEMRLLPRSSEDREIAGKPMEYGSGLG